MAGASSLAVSWGRHRGEHPLSPPRNPHPLPCTPTLLPLVLRQTLGLLAAPLPVLQDAGLLSVIADPIHAPVTLFWPSDQALQALPFEQQEFLFNQNNKDKLKEYLKFHVIRDAKVFCVTQTWVQTHPRVMQSRSGRCVPTSAEA